MNNSNVTVKISADTKQLVSKLDNATEATERLRKALEDVNNVKVVINMETSTSSKKKWYQFWK